MAARGNPILFRFRNFHHLWIICWIHLLSYKKRDIVYKSKGLFLLKSCSLPFVSSWSIFENKYSNDKTVHEYMFFFWHFMDNSRWCFRVHPFLLKLYEYLEKCLWLKKSCHSNGYWHTYKSVTTITFWLAFNRKNESFTQFRSKL